MGRGEGCPPSQFPPGVSPWEGPENFWTFAFKMGHFDAFWKALLTERHP